MKTVEVFRWYLPARTERGKPYLSAWHMSAEDAAKRGALRPEPSSRIVRELPETEAEQRAQIPEAGSMGGRSPDHD